MPRSRRESPSSLISRAAETELDNNIIQQISDPLIHLVRNAVAHGIESSEVRQSAGKPDKGHIAVRAYHRGNHIFIEVEDDGRGIDYERVRQGVIEAGELSPVAAGELSERELREYAFPSWFFNGRFDDRTGGPRRRTRRGARQPARAEWRN